jgi:energy-coupling factor transport system ATP-binding protein
MTAEPAILVEGLSFRYRTRKRPALREVSFAVARGETLLILGPSGGGKSTLALCLNGLIPHSLHGELRGRVQVDGCEVRTASVAEMARRVGLVFQDPDAEFCMLRVDDEIAFGLENLRVAAAEMPARIARALDLVGLTGAEKMRIERLSGGARQRLALACVLAMDPPVLVFDEPTSNLDPAGAEEVFAEIARLKARGGRTIVIIEHRLDHLMGVVDRVLVLGPDGSLVALGAPAEVLRWHADDLERFGVWIPQVSEVANRLVRRGVHLETYPTTVDQAVRAFGPLVREAPEPVRADRVTAPEVGGSTSPARGSSADRSEPVARSWVANATTVEAKVRGRERAVAAGETAPAPPAIHIAGLTCVYPNGKVALRDVTLSVPAGRFVAVVGPNGAGKSTLAAHLIGAVRPPAGAVRLFGRDVRTTPPEALARLVGYVFQNPEHQFVARTVFEELAFGLRVRRVPEPEIAARVEAMLADFGLAALGLANPFTLSHGEKRRLSVATMLILGQEVLVLDEPTFGQDRQNTVALMAKLVDLHHAGRTIVLITHDVRLVAEYAEEVAVLIEGAVAFAGPTDDLFRDPALQERAHLAPPPLLELGRKLSAGARAFPPAVTTDVFLAALGRQGPAGAAALGAARASWTLAAGDEAR